LIDQVTIPLLASHLPPEDPSQVNLTLTIAPLQTPVSVPSGATVKAATGEFPVSGTAPVKHQFGGPNLPGMLVFLNPR
jgi:hypothetical protein